jgi:Spy/CpxP family protein refolding chaperone
MKKLRDEMSSKMKSLRDAQKAKVMELLTPEQKKWVEENRTKPPENPQKGE